MSLCPNVITHVHTGKKTKVLIRWIAPSTGFGCVNISASVVQKGTILLEKCVINAHAGGLTKS